jgi:hypothetical protein
MIVTHGWPDCVTFVRSVGPLTNLEAHGGHAMDVFYAIVPSLPYSRHRGGFYEGIVVPSGGRARGRNVWNILLA